MSMPIVALKYKEISQNLFETKRINEKLPDNENFQYLHPAMFESLYY